MNILQKKIEKKNFFFFNNTEIYSLDRITLEIGQYQLKTSFKNDSRTRTHENI